MLAFAAAALLVTLAAPAAQAQDQGNQANQKVKTYDFSGDTIDGDLLSPDGDVVDTRTFASHTSLIRIRKDFIKEILKTAEDL
ncbi:adventurous gliding motility protein CglF [Haliangium sp.]|uniref:adventurous gliding motility protein CglF n=1 Tax=Haliangium sp. TaxID=2663208 RepID=UPI003D0EB706